MGVRNLARFLSRLFPRPVYNFPPMQERYAVLHMVNHGWMNW
jgi:hypothetical protein